MPITKREFELLVLIEKKEKKIEDSLLVDIEELLKKGYVCKIDNKYEISPLGLDELEPYKVKRAIILAAGFGSRMVPITLNTPKPLVRVKGKMIIDTLLEAIVKAGIEEVVIVRGYLWEQFDLLKYKYPNIKFIDNFLFNKENNISSAYSVKHLLKNAYVMEADLLLSNYNLIRKYEYHTNYLGMYKDYTNDWCFKVEDGIIKELNTSGDDCYHMYGISYWTEEDGEKMESSIEKVYNMQDGKSKYWDEVALRICKDEYEVNVRECKEGDVIEIDTFEELKEIDDIYGK